MERVGGAKCSSRSLVRVLVSTSPSISRDEAEAIGKRGTGRLNSWFRICTTFVVVY